MLLKMYKGLKMFQILAKEQPSLETILKIYPPLMMYTRFCQTAVYQENSQLLLYPLLDLLTILETLLMSCQTVLMP